MIAATTALSSQSAPSVGSAVGLRIRIRTAATPARNPAYANAPEITRFARTPISRAASKSSAAPRTAMPNNVRLNTSAVSASTAIVTAIVTRSMISNRTPPSSTVSNAHAGLGERLLLGRHEDLPQRVRQALDRERREQHRERARRCEPIGTRPARWRPRRGWPTRRSTAISTHQLTPRVDRP